MTTFTTDINDACRLIRGQMVESTSRLSIVIETGPDEAAVVGTVDAYLRLALAALEFVQYSRLEEATKVSIGPYCLPCTTSFGAVFGGLEVCLDSGLLTESELETQLVADYFQRLSPPS
jgi:hypothetical protein